MIESLAVGNLVAFSAQAAVIAVVAVVLPTLLRIRSAELRYGFWRTVLVVCLLLPWLQTPQVIPSRESSEPVAIGPQRSDLAPSTPPSSPIDLTLLATTAIVSGALARILWLAGGYLKLRTLRRSGVSADANEYREMCALLGVGADVRYVKRFSQPVTFGWRQPVILLPASLRDHPAPIREAVVAHELIHIQRHDWAWVVGEELVRSLFWFHPALRWLISRVQLAREEVVDAVVVSATGRRRVYMEALLALSHASRVEPASAFAWRRHLFRRIVLISQEDEMSARRVIVSVTGAVILAAASAWFAMDAFPLQANDLPMPVQVAAGPLERTAQPIAAGDTQPARRVGPSIEVPQELKAAGATATVMIRLTIDQGGNVAEARVTWLNLATPDPSSSTQGVIDAVVAAALDGVRRWQFDPPAKGLVKFDVRLSFGSGRYAMSASPGTMASPPPPPPPPPSAREAPQALEGLRAGRDIPPPRKVRDVRPLYPQEARDAQVQGVVIIEIRIDGNGEVDHARVLRSIPMLDVAAMDAVRQWQFQPTLLNGVPTPVILVVTVQFLL